MKTLISTNKFKRGSFILLMYKLLMYARAESSGAAKVLKNLADKPKDNGNLIQHSVYPKIAKK